MSPLSFPPMQPVVENGATKWNARCRSCGQWVCERPQVVKAAVEEGRRGHGTEADCARRRREAP